MNKPFPGKQVEHQSAAERLRDDVVSALRDIYDPEIPVNIYDLGLVYDLDIDPKGHVQVRMTLTSPACPVAQTFPDVVASRVSQIPEVDEVTVDLVWDPPWDWGRLSEATKLKLGLL